MNRSLILLACGTACIACGAESHERVTLTWQDDSTDGGRVFIDEGALVLEQDGPGPEVWSLSPDGASLLRIDLPGDDFEVRVTGVSLTSPSGLVGISLEGAPWSASAAFQLDGMGNAVLHAVTADSDSTIGDHSAFAASAEDEAELSFIRVGDKVEVSATSGSRDALVEGEFWGGPASLFVYLQSAPDQGPADTTRAEIAGRAVSSGVDSFADDVIE